VRLSNYIQAGQLPANEWLLVAIPLKDLNPDNLPIDTINIATVAQSASQFYIDDIRFVPVEP
jgi:hypothetical protein